MAVSENSLLRLQTSSVTATGSASTKEPMMLSDTSVCVSFFCGRVSLISLPIHYNTGAASRDSCTPARHHRGFCSSASGSIGSACRKSASNMASISPAKS